MNEYRTPAQQDHNPLTIDSVSNLFSVYLNTLQMLFLDLPVLIEDLRESPDIADRAIRRLEIHLERIRQANEGIK
jgi:hypothetical protein